MGSRAGLRTSSPEVVEGQDEAAPRCKEAPEPHLGWAIKLPHLQDREARWGGREVHPLNSRTELRP